MPRTDHSGSIATILALLGERQTFVVSSHARPDGDAIGSALGLMHLLDAMGKDVTVAFSDPIPNIYRNIPGVDRITRTLPATTPDAVVLLECDGVPRTGFTKIPAKFVLNIDHHLSGKQFGDYNWIDPHATAVGAMVYDIAAASGLPITASMATCLYTALITDTGAFTYPVTKAATFALAERLVNAGADASGVAEAVYFSNSASKMRLLGIALSKMEIDGEVAWSSVTQEDMQRAGANVEDCEGVVNYLIAMENISAACFLRELPSGEQFRLSLRSKGRVDVATVAAEYSGGGHRNASGGIIDGPLEAANSRLIAELHAACVKAADYVSSR